MGSVKNWSVDQTAEWLVREGFGNYTAGFISREINGSKLLDLREIQVQKIFQSKEVERRFWAKVRRLSAVQPRQRCQSSESNVPKNHAMFGHHGSRPQQNKGPALPPGRSHMAVHDRPAPPGRQGPNGRTGVQGRPHQMTAFQHVQHSFDDDDDDEWSDDDDPTIYENNDRPQAPPPLVQRHPVDPHSRPPYIGGYPPVQSHPQVPPRPADRPPVDDPEDMYLIVDNPHGENEFGRGKFQPDQVPSGLKHNQPYPLPSHNHHPPPVQPRQPQILPNFNKSPAEDDQGLYEPPLASCNPVRPEVKSGHRSSMPERGNRQPMIPSRDMSDRRSSSSLGPRGGSKNSSNGSISHSSAGSSGEHIDVISGSPRNNKPPFPAFQDMKPPTNGFSNFPGRNLNRQPEPKPLPPTGGRAMPKMTSPSKPAVGSKPQSGFKLPDFTSQPANRNETPPILQGLQAGLASINARRIRDSYEDSCPTGKPQTSDSTISPQKSPFRASGSAEADLKSQPWYKNVGRQEASSAINRNRQEGCFIVRPSSKNDPKVPYSLTVYSQNQLFNLIIRCRSTDNLYALGTKKSNEVAKSSVAELIEFYMYSDLVLADDKGSVRLSGPP